MGVRDFFTRTVEHRRAVKFKRVEREQSWNANAVILTIGGILAVVLIVVGAARQAQEEISRRSNRGAP